MMDKETLKNILCNLVDDDYITFYLDDVDIDGSIDCVVKLLHSEIYLPIVFKAGDEEYEDIRILSNKITEIIRDQKLKQLGI